ncbi:MAG: hypothetical protein HY275_09010 [Gemmatimonadetes bacterium]|nr:hypothetical protein [Gemmatimonadota bacterium]
MRRLLLVIGASGAALARATAQGDPPIIDMHMHAMVAAQYGGTGLPMCAPPRCSPTCSRAWRAGT